MMKRLSFYTRYERLGASSRIRFMQFFTKLSAKFEINYQCLLSDQYILNLYNGTKQNKLLILWQYIRRFFHVCMDKSDFLIIEKELFPYLPYCFEKFCLRNKKYIIDIDDAVFLNYTKSDNKYIKKLLSNKFMNLFANSFAVLSGSEYLVQEAKLSGARNVIYYPTVIDWDKYSDKLIKYQRAEKYITDRIIIGWIGSNSTIKYVNILNNVLTKLAAQYPDKFTLKIIGATTKLFIDGVDVQYVKWSEDNEIDDILNIDIGIMPLEDSDWEKGKCAYKLIQYMACGKPVIASSVGANNYVVENGVTGYLCQNLIDWFNAFNLLINDRELRHNMGEAGVARIKQEFTIDNNISILAKLLDTKE